MFLARCHSNNIARTPLACRARHSTTVLAHIRVATRAGVRLTPQEAFAMAERTRRAAEAEGGARLASSVANGAPRHRRWRQHAFRRFLSLAHGSRPVREQKPNPSASPVPSWSWKSSAPQHSVASCCSLKLDPQQQYGRSRCNHHSPLGAHEPEERRGTAPARSWRRTPGFFRPRRGVCCAALPSDVLLAAGASAERGNAARNYVVVC